MKFLYLFISLAFLISCKSGIDTKKEAEANTDNEEKIAQNFDLDTLKGMYIGDFGGSDIRIVLNYISPNHAVGYNLHKGLQRNINGKVEETDKTVTLELNEPGDDKYDGVFTLTFQKIDFSCKGTWKANNKKFGKKSFVLEKMNFESHGLDIYTATIDSINKGNFTDVFSYCSDSIAEIYFEADGSVRYEFYPSKDNAERAEQVQIVKGTWTFKKDKVQINWQKNEVFAEKKSYFDIHINPEFDIYLLYKGRKFMTNYYNY